MTGTIPLPPSHRPNGKLAPKNKLGRGRPKGSPNQINRDFRELMREAVERHGSNGKGAGGSAGFADFLIRERFESFISLYGKTIPRVTESDVTLTDTTPTVLQVTILPITSGTYLTGDGVEEQLVTEVEHQALMARLGLASEGDALD